MAKQDFRNNEGICTLPDAICYTNCRGCLVDSTGWDYCVWHIGDKCTRPEEEEDK